MLVGCEKMRYWDWGSLIRTSCFAGCPVHVDEEHTSVPNSAVEEDDCNTRNHPFLTKPYQHSSIHTVLKLN